MPSLSIDIFVQSRFGVKSFVGKVTTLFIFEYFCMYKKTKRQNNNNNNGMYKIFTCLVIVNILEGRRIEQCLRQSDVHSIVEYLGVAFT